MRIKHLLRKKRQQFIEQIKRMNKEQWVMVAALCAMLFLATYQMYQLFGILAEKSMLALPAILVALYMVLHWMAKIRKQEKLMEQKRLEVLQQERLKELQQQTE